MSDVVVLGGGESGVGAALLARHLGLSVLVSDAGSIKDSFRRELDEMGIPYEFGGHSEVWRSGKPLVVKSPGIPNDVGIVPDLRKAGLTVIGEVEFGYRHLGKRRIIGVTGSNGKSTTTSLIDHILRKCGIASVACGNLGTSFCRSLVEDSECDVFVVELSSFQLDDMVDFKPNIGVILNITPDHLDRYGGSMDAYTLSKMSISRNQPRGRGHVLVVNGDDAGVSHGLELVSPRVDTVYYSSSRRKGMASYVRKDRLYYIDEYGGAHRVGVKRIGLEGEHNLQNCCAAVVACMRFSGRVSWKGVRKGLRTFRGLPHRMEYVGSVQGRRFINDSKATNVDSAKWALESINEGKIVWIAGGTDKGNDYSLLEDVVRNRVRSLVCLGVDNRKLLESFSPLVERVIETRDMRTAVESACEAAEIGDTVLLSPACASFDLFKNFEDRGDQFRAAVQELGLTVDELVASVRKKLRAAEEKGLFESGRYEESRGGKGKSKSKAKGKGKKGKSEKRS